MELAGLTAHHVAETGSTNSDLLARVQAAAAAGATTFAPCLLVAGRQTAGRGRHGRRWHGEAGASLAFSLAWPFAAGHSLAGLSLAVGVAVADALDPAAAGPMRRRLALKWPNDLLLVGGDDDAESGAGRKLGGVLIETAPLATGRVAVIGIGLNVAAVHPDEAASGVAWLGELDAGATPSTALHLVATPLVAALQRFASEGFAAFAAGYEARDFLRGRRVAFAGRPGDTEPLSGTASGISRQGELLVATPRGLRPVTSGEVRLRLDRSAEPAPC